MGTQQMKRPQAGFTLMEVLITMVIIGILAAVAIPNYTSHVRKGKRASAKAMMMQIASSEERYYTERNAYATTLTALGYPTDSLATANGTHNVSITGTATTYTITAAPATASPDAECGSLTLNHLGVWGNGTNLPVARC